MRYLETTVAPSNEASRKMFASFARRKGVVIDKINGFEPDEFPADGDAHEAEHRYRIGPLVAVT